MLACYYEFRLRWWLLFVAISYYNCFVVAQTTIQPLNLQVLVGGSASFVCNSAENKTWSWYKVDRNFNDSKIWEEGTNPIPAYAFFVDGQRGKSRFTILNTTLDDDETQYYCKCGSTSNKTTLEVIVGTKLDKSYPQCEADFTSLNTKNKVTMTCRANGGYPRPSLQWYRNGEILATQEDIVSNKNDDVAYFYEFTREMTVQVETAVYTCRADGPAVEGNQNCSISVATPPTVTIIASTTYFNAGDSLEFACIVMSPWNIVDYKWTVNNQSLTSTNAIFKNDKSTIIISHLQSEDAGKEIGCNAITSSGLNGNDSVIISLFDIDQKNNQFQLITIVVGGVIALALLCVTLFLLIRQRQKQNRTNKTTVLRTTSIAQGAPLDGQDFCISEENSAYGNNTSFPISGNPWATLHHYYDHIDVNGDQENVPR
ncbi:cell adhesion molecule 2-like [Anneissia japonica]|uniref:cell adhesion molecule 2-like n=1 Tax=Anneissia japonica TaxID=1529436 RepID=UPI00142567EC|nr:cell adhesion molecule 2-like [Anneissia japonica]